MKITLYGAPQIAKDSEKTIVNKCTKKEVITHSADYCFWRNSIIKQLRLKYIYNLKKCNINYDFYLNKLEDEERIDGYIREINSCLIQTKVFDKDVCLTKSWSVIITNEMSRIEITI